MLRLLYRVSDAVRRQCLGDDHGAIGEDLAHGYLRRRGCNIVARNYRPRSGMGEIDLVAWHGSTLVFIEVKTRKTAEYGLPERSVDAEKRSRIWLAARDYARRAGVAWESTRFDIVSVMMQPRLQIEWLRDAFPLCGESSAEMRRRV
jgi:putative endonuclease